MTLTRLWSYLYRNPFTLIMGIILVLFMGRLSVFKAPPKTETSSLPKVVVMPMTAGSIEGSIQLNGHTLEARRVILKAKTSGRILSLLAKKGQKIQKDQDLVLLDPEDRPARLAEAKAKLDHRTLEFEAHTKLESKAVKSTNALAGCKADYECAKSALARIEQEIADSHIKAPFDGILEETFVETGDVVNVGMDDKIATVIDLDPLKITCHVAEKDISRLKPGKKAEVTLPSLDDQKLSAQVTYIAKAADPKTRTYRVELEANNPDMAIPAGLTARIRFLTGKTTGYLVSPAVVSSGDEGSIGVKTVENNKVVFHPVQILETKPEGFVVTGLPDAINLVVTGGGFVTSGQKVEVSSHSKKGASAPLEGTSP